MLASWWQPVKKNVTIDWIVRAQLRVIVERIQRKHGCPPDKQEEATQTVSAQAALPPVEWAAA
jgi:type I restriction enzyme R subunit